MFATHRHRPRRGGRLLGAAAVAAVLAAPLTARAQEPADDDEAAEAAEGAGDAGAAEDAGDAGAAGAAEAAEGAEDETEVEPEVGFDTRVSGSATTPAVAEPEPSADVVREDMAMTSVQGSTSSVRSQVAEWMIMPAGSRELGGSLTFVTSEPALAEGPLRFTDVALLQLRGRTSIRGKVEVGAGVDLLPKQPSYLDESVWQGARLGAKVGLKPRLALETGAAAGPLLGNDGHWGGADLALLWRKPVDPSIWFLLAGGASVTALEGDTVDSFWMTEASARGQTILREPRGMFGAWAGVDFRVPVAHADSTFDPHTRLNFHIGALLGIVDDLDLFVEYAIIDRGDLSAPETLLPVLAGGFDQRHLVFGVVRRFEADAPARPPTYMAY